MRSHGGVQPRPAPPNLLGVVFFLNRFRLPIKTALGLFLFSSFPFTCHFASFTPFLGSFLLPHVHSFFDRRPRARGLFRLRSTTWLLRHRR